MPVNYISEMSAILSGAIFLMHDLVVTILVIIFPIWFLAQSAAAMLPCYFNTNMDK